MVRYYYLDGGSSVRSILERHGLSAAPDVVAAALTQRGWLPEKANYAPGDAVLQQVRLRDADGREVGVGRSHGEDAARALDEAAAAALADALDPGESAR